MAKVLMESKSYALTEGVFGWQYMTSKDNGKSVRLSASNRQRFEAVLIEPFNDGSKSKNWQTAYVHLVLDRFGWAVHGTKAAANTSFTSLTSTQISGVCARLADHLSRQVLRDTWLISSQPYRTADQPPEMFRDDDFAIIDQREGRKFDLRLVRMGAQFPISDTHSKWLIELFQTLEYLPGSNLWVRTKAKVIAARHFCASIATGKQQELMGDQADSTLAALTYFAIATSRRDTEF